MRPLALLFAALAASQSVINYGLVPACARSCELLQQAQSACIPAGGAPVTNQQTYNACFCQSAYLAVLYTSSVTLCPGTCSSADEQKIQNWYIGLCKNGVGGVTGAPSQPAASTAAAATGAATSGAATGSAGSSGTISDENPSWWSQHGRWIAMIIVLIVGFGIIIAIGLIWKKRHNRKRDLAMGSGSNNARSSMAAPPVVWSQRNHHPGSVTTLGTMEVEKGYGPGVSSRNTPGASGDALNQYSSPPETNTVVVLEKETKTKKLKKLVGK